MFHSDHYRLSGSPRCLVNTDTWGFPGDSDGKESACNMGDPGLVTGLRRSLGGGHGSVLAWRIPWTEEPEGLQPMGRQRVGQDSATNTFSHRLYWAGQVDTNETGALPWEPQSNSTDWLHQLCWGSLGASLVFGQRVRVSWQGMETISRLSGEEILDRGMDWAGWQQQWVCLGKGQQGPSAPLLDFTFSPVGDGMTSHSYRGLGWVLCEQEGKWESKGTPSFLGWKPRARLQAHETYMIFWSERLPVMCEYLHRQHFGRMQGKCCFIQAVDVQIGD